MSGDFVQRGAPAIIDKYCRAEMALLCGADLVIELPAVWAVSSAEDFAMAGVTLFDKMGCIDGICFGAESDQLPQLKSIAGVLAEEPDIYRSALSSYLKKGLAFPAARAAALSDYFKSTGIDVYKRQSKTILFANDLNPCTSILFRYILNLILALTFAHNYSFGFKSKSAW